MESNNGTYLSKGKVRFCRADKNSLKITSGWVAFAGNCIKRGMNLRIRMP